MTDPMTADKVYLRELTPASIKKIVEEERPDAVLPTMGGQTGLNLADVPHHRITSYNVCYTKLLR